MTVTTITPSLTDEDIEILNAARTVLDTARKNTQDAAWIAMRSKLDDYSKPNAADYGRMMEAVETAEHAIFKVLNIINSHNLRQLTDEQIHNRPDVDVPA